MDEIIENCGDCQCLSDKQRKDSERCNRTSRRRQY